jgi:hypothetical protein
MRRKFDSSYRDQVLFQCSTAVVQLTVNQLVVGSIPTTGANFHGDAAVMVWQGTVNPPTYVTTGSIPVISTTHR